MRRAPVDEVEAKLHAIGGEIEALGKEIAAAPSDQRDSKQTVLNGLINQQSALRFERDEIIRMFFYRK